MKTQFGKKLQGGESSLFAKDYSELNRAKTLI